jgi:WD40 repeat protein
MDADEARGFNAEADLDEVIAAYLKAAEAGAAPDQAELIGYAATSAARDQSLRHLYAAHMNLAKEALDTHSDDQLLTLLSYYAPPAAQADLRGWEWHYLRARCRIRLNIPAEGWYAWNQAVAWSPDGRWLAGSATPDGSLRVWDAATGQKVWSVVAKGPAPGERASGACSVAWSPDGQRVAWATSREKTVRVLDIASGGEPRTLSGHPDWVLAVSWGPDGRLASAAADHTVLVWDAKTGTELPRLRRQAPPLDPHTFVTLHWSPDGGQLAVSSQLVQEGTVIWDVARGTVIQTLTTSAQTWSPDGRRFANAFAVVDAATGKAVTSLGKEPPQHDHRVAWSPDGRWLAESLQLITTRIRNASTGDVAYVFRGPTGPLAWSPDSRRVAVGTTIWDLPTRESLVLGDARSQPQEADWVDTVTWSPDSSQVASITRDGTVQVRDARTAETVFRLAGDRETHWSSLAWSGDGGHLAAVTIRQRAVPVATVTVWDTRGWREVKRFTDLEMGNRYPPQFALAWSPDGRWLAGPGSGVLKVWEVGSWQEVFRVEAGGGLLPFLVGWHGSRELIFQEAWDLKAWDPATGKVSRRPGLVTGGSRRVGSPDGRWLAAEWGHDILLLPSGEQRSDRGRRLRGHTDQVDAFAWSPDSRRLASTGRDGTVKVWDPGTGLALLTFRAESPTGAFHGVAFSPDGLWLAAGRDNGTVLIWDATDDRLTFPYPGLVRSLPWVPAGEEAETLRDVAYLTACSLLVLAAPGGLVFCTWRSPKRGVRLLTLAVAIYLGFAALWFLTRPALMQTLLIRQSSGAPRGLFAVLAGLPLVAFAALLVLWAVQRRWWRLGSLVAAFLLASLVLTSYGLWTDPRRMDPLQHYSSDGWYFVLFIGAFAAGALAMVLIVFGPAARVIWRWVRKISPVPAG